MQNNLPAWQFSACLHIVVHLVVEAALEFCTHSSQLLRIERNVLKTCGIGTHTYEVLHPCGTAQLAPTRSCTANASSLLTGSNLFHLNPHVECVGKHLDELSEIHALVGNIIEYSLIAVALIFHVAYFHLQSEVFCYLATLYHCSVLPALSFAVFVHIGGAGNAIDTPDVVSRL